MARAQNARRGFLQKQSLTVGTGTITTGTITTATITTANITTLNPTSINIASNLTLSANTTGITSSSVTKTAGTDKPGNLTSTVFLGLLYNSTGRAVFINTTGTTHLYLAGTTKQPTT